MLRRKEKIEDLSRSEILSPSDKNLLQFILGRLSLSKQQVGTMVSKAEIDRFRAAKKILDENSVYHPLVVEKPRKQVPGVSLYANLNSSNNNNHNANSPNNNTTGFLNNKPFRNLKHSTTTTHSTQEQPPRSPPPFHPQNITVNTNPNLIQSKKGKGLVSLGKPTYNPNNDSHVDNSIYVGYNEDGSVKKKSKYEEKNKEKEKEKSNWYTEDIELNDESGLNPWDSKLKKNQKQSNKPFLNHHQTQNVQTNASKTNNHSKQTTNHTSSQSVPFRPAPNPISSSLSTRMSANSNSNSQPIAIPKPAKPRKIDWEQVLTHYRTSSEATAISSSKLRDQLQRLKSQGKTDGEIYDTINVGFPVVAGIVGYLDAKQSEEPPVVNAAKQIMPKPTPASNNYAEKISQLVNDNRNAKANSNNNNVNNSNNVEVISLDPPTNNQNARQQISTSSSSKPTSTPNSQLELARALIARRNAASQQSQNDFGSSQSYSQQQPQQQQQKPKKGAVVVDLTD